VAETAPLSISLVYWTDRDPHPVRIDHSGGRQAPSEFSVPAQQVPTIIYYYFEARWPAADGSVITQDTPPSGPASPSIRFVTEDHLGDADRRNDLLDVFDIVRLVRHEAWHEPIENNGALDLDGDGALTAADLDLAAGELVKPAGFQTRKPSRGTIKDLRSNSASATLVLNDGSTLTVPKAFSGRVTDLQFDGKLVEELYRSRRSFASLKPSPEAVERMSHANLKYGLSTSFDAGFERDEPRKQDRYMALGLVNLRETPVQFAIASLRRVLRLFVVYGSTDAFRARQFRFSQLVYGAATIASLAYLALFAAGAVIAIRRRQDVMLPLLAVLFVPATIFPLFGDARFTVTAQPFVFVFIAVSVIALADRRGQRRSTQ
jgi:hypothetical protein